MALNLCFRDSETADIDMNEVVYPRISLVSGTHFGVILSKEWASVKLEIGDKRYVNYARELLPTHAITLLVRSKELTAMQLQEISTLYPTLRSDLMKRKMQDASTLFDYCVELGVDIRVF